MDTIRQTLTEGGSLYGYTAAELEPHITEYGEPVECRYHTPAHAEQGTLAV